MQTYVYNFNSPYYVFSEWIFHIVNNKVNLNKYGPQRN